MKGNDRYSDLATGAVFKLVGFVWLMADFIIAKEHRTTILNDDGITPRTSHINGRLHLSTTTIENQTPERPRIT